MPALPHVEGAPRRVAEQGPAEDTRPNQLLSIFVPGRPVAFARAGRKGKGSYTPPEQAGYMAYVATVAKTAMARAGYRPFIGPVELTYRATYAYPKTWSLKRRAKTHFRIATPDADNLVKLACDALEGICYENDRQVQLGPAHRVFGSPEGVVITIQSLTDSSES